jgi:hypothetical protein
MKKKINFGIGFITGRPNVCKIINSYCEYLVNQVKDIDTEITFTFFILFDLGYQFTTRTDFYGILPKTYKYVNIKYITPEEIDEQKKILMSKYGLTYREADLFIGKGYAKARNAILYYALKRKIDYLFFWDDDEYPLAAIKKENEVIWKKQPTIKEHLASIENSDITVGHRCGVMSPIPYIEYTENFKEEDYKLFIEGISNEVINWEAVQNTRKKDGFLGYADEDIVLKKNEAGIPKVISKKGETPIIYGSNLCLNLNHIDKIPAFYNPPEARGEDSLFACAMVEKNTKVVSVPTYHFHDGFLKFTSLMKDRFPKRPLKISLEDNNIEQRFYKATIGWTKYKPLYFYINDKEHYREFIDNSLECLNKSVDKISQIFETCDFNALIPVLKEYDKNVATHYNEYLETNKIWDKLKVKIKNEGE